MKFLLLLVVVGVALWLFKTRRRVDRPDAPRRSSKPPKPDAPQRMLACAHCGVHLPQGDALMDASDRPFCSDAHRLAGPRA